MAGLGRLPRELEQFRPIIEQHVAAASIAPDEATRRLTIDEAIRAMFEVVTGIETDPGTTPEQRFKFWFSILWALWVVLWSAHAAQRRELDESLQEAARVAAVRLQAQTVASLTETIVRLEARLAVQEAPEVLVRIARRSSVREAPSGSTRCVARVEAGQPAVLITRFLRWDYVELVGADGVRTGIVGWIHHRRVRTPRVN